jgi:hypothetical protein
MTPVRSLVRFVLIGGICLALGPGQPAPPGGEVAPPRLATAEPVPEKRYLFVFLHHPWRGPNGVLEWLAQTSGMPCVVSAWPHGKVTFLPRLGLTGPRLHTIDEIIDIINNELEPQRLALVRRQDYIGRIFLDAEPPSPPPPVRLEDLRWYHPKEHVTIRLAVRAGDADQLLLTIRALLGQDGQANRIGDRLFMRGAVERLRIVLNGLGIDPNAPPKE